tara:strand:- start:679 stop:1290 length:612 start_codon:yes stop_codon:yes gene_type:complete
MSKRVCVFLVLLLSVSGLYAQDLFQDESTQRVVTTAPVSSESVSMKADAVATPAPKKDSLDALDQRYFSIGIESLLTRGDVQIYYEIPKPDADMIWVFMGHFNPHAQHQVDTGKFGVYAGVRTYFEKNHQGGFAQLMGGLNYEASDTIKPSALLGIGYKYHIKPKLFMEAGFYFSRSYESSRGSDAYALLSLGLELDYQIPFL